VTLWQKYLSNLTSFKALYAIAFPTTLHHPLLTQQRCKNMDGVMGKCGRMCAITKSIVHMLEAVEASKHHTQLM